MRETVQLVSYDRGFLDKSWAWLSDPEIKSLTMTPDFDRDSQKRFFASLPTRSDYHIWGVALANGRPIGAAGLKHISGETAEYWGYIGEKDCWGRGLGMQLVCAVEEQARAIGMESLYLTVAASNRRAVALYRRSGFAAADESTDPLVMLKVLAK